MAGFRGSPIEYEPKKENRFILEFPTELAIENYQILSVDKPKMDINRVSIPYFDQETFVTGKITFQPISITMIDYIGPSGTQKFMEWLRLHHEILTNRSGYASGYKKTLTIRATDPVGVTVSVWTLYDCQITSVDFGAFDYTNDDVSKVTFTVQPDRVESEY